MNKKLLKQIKNLPGVKLVNLVRIVPECVIVEFEPEIEYIQCNTKEEYDFLFPIIHPGTFNPTIWVNFTKYPVWIKCKECKTTKECTAIIKPEGIIVDASEYMTPHLIGEFQNYMIKQAEKRFPEGCTVHWPNDNVTHRNIKKPFKHMGEHIQDVYGCWLWCKYEGWAELVKEKPEAKRLEHYEKTLLEWRADGMNVFGERYMVYSWLKKNKPEIYCREVLKVIADELNEGYSLGDPWRIGFDRQTGVCKPIGVLHSTAVPDEVIFWSEKAAKKAIQIMGDKLRYLNGQPTPES